jgi:hypothetical protein
MGIEIDFLAVGDGSKSGDAIAVRFGNLYGMMNDVAGRVGRGGLLVIGISHGVVSFVSSSGCANRGLMVSEKKSLGAGAKRNAQRGKLGETFRGNRFSACASRLGL